MPNLCINVEKLGPVRKKQLRIDKLFTCEESGSSLIRATNEICISDCMTYFFSAAVVRTWGGTRCFLFCAEDHLDHVGRPSYVNAHPGSNGIKIYSTLSITNILIDYWLIGYVQTLKVYWRLWPELMLQSSRYCMYLDIPMVNECQQSSLA